MNDIDNDTFNKDKQEKVTISCILLKILILNLSIFISIKYFSNNSDNNYKHTNSAFRAYLDAKNKSECEKYDPYFLFQSRFYEDPIYLCKNDDSEHLCYINTNILNVVKNGLTCKMKNFILNTSKWKSEDQNYINDNFNKSNESLFLDNGFFNMKCKKQEKKEVFSPKYHSYLNAWNYSLHPRKQEQYDNIIEELSSNKTILFVNRNKNTFNIFFSMCAVMNALLLIEHYNLNPDNIQVIFIESIEIKFDPLYDMYKNIISRGIEPIHISQLAKQIYHVTEAFYVPINWDSPLFTKYHLVDKCDISTKGYIYFNDLVNKYMKITFFNDPEKYDNETYYYPKAIKYPNSPIYTTFLTFQWRKVWPKGRKGQERLLGNGIEIIEKLYEVLPKTTLIRLVDTSQLSINEQISLMKKTDYFIGIHGAGLALSAFMPNTSILNEISNKFQSDNLLIVSKLSGHKTYSDYLSYKTEYINDNQYLYFNPDSISERVYARMNETFYKTGFRHKFL